MAAEDRNGGATIQNKMKIATAATSALSSGRVRILLMSDGASAFPRTEATGSD